MVRRKTRLTCSEEITVSIEDFMRTADGPVRIRLRDGSSHTGRFRTDILAPSALSAYFYGDAHDMSLPIDAVVGIEALAASIARA